MYLDTNGFDGYVDWSTMALSTDSARFAATKEEFGIDDDRLWNKMCGDNASNILSSEFNLTYKVDTLTLPQAEQNVDEVREAAPNWFKMGNRLITKNDYEFFFKSQYS